MAGTITTALKRALHQLLWVYSKWLLLVFLVAYAASGIYKIEKDGIGVLTRFGRVVEPGVQPGLHYKLPYPIDVLTVLPVKEVKTLAIQDFGSRFRMSEGGASYQYYKATELEPYCITGDNNIIAVALVLKYTIEDPLHYLFSMKEPELFVERSAANAIVHHMARLKIDEILTFGKKQLEFNLQNAILEELESFGTGIHISFLEIKEINPPNNVQKDFDRVINAEVKKKQALHQAQGYYNRIVPQARSEADRIIQEAKAYKREKILTAEGEASRFLSLYKGYQENPQAQREKLYLEFIRSLYPTLNEIRVVNSRMEDSPLLLPINKNE
jgi:membrane protease subunit HflK